ncbi:Protein CBR-SRH-7 [Caenorhabditis briggsae]|uniref:Protein CBR-SRH-7 n=1 Tax=Caenorhabditis briggsae TaxID=6238 RepID=A8X2F7_CAEBR|nr:Protein CBR-SRH-7 [Caenorhabditis briggsae]CAP26817.1 Protein CBR-SRH-7 [Caenorhabditis briggsae]
MLNETCNFEEPFANTIIHYVSTSISIPMYGVAFWILIFRSPTHFKSYRNFLVSHIFSGLLLEIHMGMIWKVTIVLPIPIMCSNNFIAEYAPIVFQFLPLCLVYTGTSIISLFVFRMEAVNVHRFEKSILQRLVYLIRYGFFVSIVVVLVITALIYPDLKYQKEYKTKMEQRFGQFQSYMWCDNCFFFNFDSTLFRYFFNICAIAVVLGTSSGALAFFLTVYSINSVKSQLSGKTKKMHRNFLISLVISALIHGICILVPLIGFLWAITLVISLSQFPYFPYILTLIIQEHGAASTVTMFMTNNLLRQTFLRIFWKFPASSESQIQNLQSTTMN